MCEDNNNYDHNHYNRNNHNNNKQQGQQQQDKMSPVQYLLDSVKLSCTW